MNASNTFTLRVSYSPEQPLSAVIDRMALATRFLGVLDFKLDEIQITPAGLGEDFACLIRDSGKLDGIPVKPLR
jgi:hypothetical protein